MLRSLALRTDLLALGPAAVVERSGDAVAVRMPAEPDFWSGNLLIRLTPPEPPEAEEARFRAAFPAASHLTIAWDDPATEPGPLRAAWGEEAVHVDDVLARDGPPPPVPPPEGCVLRPLDPGAEADWAASLALSLAVEAAEGRGGAAHAAFRARRVAARRAQAAAGDLRWWGAFEGGAMVAQMGLVEDAALARFQDVETHPAHRRRGLCAALLAAAGGAARAARLVIVAAEGGDAGRLYRRAGFALRERCVSAHRPGS